MLFCYIQLTAVPWCYWANPFICRSYCIYTIARQLSKLNNFCQFIMWSFPFFFFYFLISGESWTLTRALIAFLCLVACFVQYLFTSLPPDTTLYGTLWCCHISSYTHSAELMIIFQRSMVWFGRPFDKLAGDWLTLKCQRDSADSPILG